MTDLFELAGAMGVTVEYMRLPLSRSMSVYDEAGDFVLMDYSLIHRYSLERLHLAHELGHCKAGAFYGIHAPAALRHKAECKAKRHAIALLMPLTELYAAYTMGYTESWELADYFGLPESFVTEAMEYYGQ